MAEQIIPIDDITRRAQQAVEAGLPVTACPFTENTEAAIRWQKAYHAREMERLSEEA